MPVCQYFLKGTCRYGSNCKNIHPGRGGGGAQHKKGGFHQSHSMMTTPTHQPSGFSGMEYSQSTFGRGGFQQQQHHHRGRGRGRGGRGGGGSNWQGQGHGPDTRRATIKDDFIRWPKWPFSCYGWKGGEACDISGDYSFEEVRWTAMQAPSEAHAKHNEMMQKQAVEQQRQEFLNSLSQRPGMALDNRGGMSMSDAAPSTLPFHQQIQQTGSMLSTPFQQQGQPQQFAPLMSAPFQQQMAQMGPSPLQQMSSTMQTQMGPSPLQQMGSTMQTGPSPLQQMGSTMQTQMAPSPLQQMGSTMQTQMGPSPLQQMGSNMQTGPSPLQQMQPSTVPVPAATGSATAPLSQQIQQLPPAQGLPHPQSQPVKPGEHGTAYAMTPQDMTHAFQQQDFMLFRIPEDPPPPEMA